MNIVYSSDENYAQHLCVSLVSLLENNKTVQTLNVFIISNGISEDSKLKIAGTAERFGRKIDWIDFGPFESKLNLNMEWPISISAYARLFLPKMLPETCERVIYIDCDTVICRSLSEMWETELGDCSVGGVLDTVLPRFKCAVGLDKRDNYINSGVLLIDLNKWRQRKSQDKFLQFIEDHHGRVTHHDQGTINGVLHDEILVLHPEFNAMTPIFTTKYNRLLRFYELEQYYSEEEVRCAIIEPVIIHYTPGLIGRVWEYECRHPKAERYRTYLELTPWKGKLVHAERQPVKQKLLCWAQKNWPVKLLKLLLRSR